MLRNRNGKENDHITNVNFGKVRKDLYETHPLTIKYISRLHRVQAGDEFYVISIPHKYPLKSYNIKGG